MAKPKNKQKQQVKQLPISKKIAKKQPKKLPKKKPLPAKRISKTGKKLAKNKKSAKYSESDFSDSSPFDQDTPYDEETSNPISESDSKQSWSEEDDDSPIKNKKKLQKKKYQRGGYHGPSKTLATISPIQKPVLTLKQQAEQKWDSKIKKWLEITPNAAKKEIEEMNLELFDKLQLGNELTDYVKKMQKIGIDKTKYIYNSAQLSEFKKLKEQLASRTVKELQEELVKNEQPKTDVKAALLERVIDGRILGKIPKCPQCFGGRLRFNNQTGLYICPGYVDGGDNCVKGDDYIFCFGRYASILRESWKQ